MQKADSVLVIDDDDVCLRILNHCLAGAGYAVSLARSAEEGMELARSTKFDLMLVDYHLPGADGCWFATHVRTGRTAAAIPIIFISGDTDELTVSKFVDVGASDVISKPFVRPLLLQRVRRVLEESRLTREVALMHALTVARDRARRELIAARRVQEAVLPATPICAPPWTATAALRPYKQVGGDFYDVVMGLRGSLIVVLGDVAGHGVAAALVATALMGELRARLARDEPRSVLLTLNERFVVTDGSYACAAVVVCEGSRVHVINAGLPSVALVRRGCIATTIVASGPPIGLLPGATYEVTKLDTEPGDRVVLVTDGLTEPFGDADDVRPALSMLGVLSASSSSQRTSRAELSSALGAMLSVLPSQPDDAAVVLLERACEVEVHDGR